MSARTVAEQGFDGMMRGKRVVIAEMTNRIRAFFGCSLATYLRRRAQSSRKLAQVGPFERIPTTSATPHGAEGLANMGRLCFPTALQIVDFYHAMEHARKVLQALLGSKELANYFGIKSKTSSRPHARNAPAPPEPRR
jgi:hypothetical protein